MYFSVLGEVLSAEEGKDSERIRKAVCLVLTDYGVTGTGTVISKTGMVVTAAHIMVGKGMPAVKDIVLQCDGKRLAVKSILFVDRDMDIALLRLNRPVRHFISLRRDDSPLGIDDKVTLVGHPSDSRGGLHRLSSTNGKIIETSAKKSMFGDDIIRIKSDATAGPGNSGGPFLIKDATGMFVAGIVLEAGKDHKEDLHTKSYGIDASTLKYAINYTRESKRYLPTAQACLEGQRVLGCSKKARSLWMEGRVRESKDLYRNECRKGSQEGCKMASRIQFVQRRFADSEEGNGFFDEPNNGQSRELEDPNAVVDNTPWWSSWNIWTFPLLALLILTLSTIIRLFRPRKTKIEKDLSRIKREQEQAREKVFNAGAKRVPHPFPKDRLNEPVSFKAVSEIKERRRRICREIENLQQEFKQELAGRTKKDPNISTAKNQHEEER